jgi:Fe2+ or Zn2+ uptake regulation protein
MKEARRHTKQLRVVWDSVKNESSHPTADQVYEKVRSVMPTISLGTVYRNLQKLVGEKKLKVLTLGRTQHFDPMTDRHDHFICEKCERVYDIFVSPKEKILASSSPKRGFKVTSHQLTLYGICKRCSS